MTVTEISTAEVTADAAGAPEDALESAPEASINTGFSDFRAAAMIAAGLVGVVLFGYGTFASGAVVRRGFKDASPQLGEVLRSAIRLVVESGAEDLVGGA